MCVYAHIVIAWWVLSDACSHVGELLIAVETGTKVDYARYVTQIQTCV